MRPIHTNELRLFEKDRIKFGLRDLRQAQITARECAIHELTVKKDTFMESTIHEITVMEFG